MHIRSGNIGAQQNRTLQIAAGKPVVHFCRQHLGDDIGAQRLHRADLQSIDLNQPVGLADAGVNQQISIIVKLMAIAMPTRSGLSRK